MKKIDIKALTLAIGLTWGIGALFLGWVAAFGWGKSLVEGLSTLYIGFKPGFFGGIIGGLWAFVDGAICGFLISFFYNYCGEMPKKKKSTKKSRK